MHEFSGGPPAHLQRVAAQRKSALLQRPADHLVDRVVASDVLAQADELALGGEETGGVESTARREAALSGEKSLRLGEDVSDIK